MILGIGSDITSVSRIEANFVRHGQRFLRRCFTQAEYEYALAQEARGGVQAVAAALAKRFAAKEACAKALGSGVAEGVRLRDMEVMRDAKGKPSLQLHGRAAVLLAHQTPKGYQPRAHLTLSDEGDLAVAMVVLEAVAAML